jgi:hypothetical protein
VTIMDRLNALDRRFNVGQHHTFDEPEPWWKYWTRFAAVISAPGVVLISAGARRMSGTSGRVQLGVGIGLVSVAIGLISAGMW